jgi:RimJ/RimL family protein N-acetyltransferase
VEENDMLTIATAADGSSFLEVVDRPGLLLPGVTVRPLGRSEAAPVLEVFAGMSAHSRRMRFLTAVPVMTDSMLERLTDIDHDVHGSWVATVGAEAVGLGRYVRIPEVPGTAEVALDVVDRYQGHGLGTLLLEVVGAAAAAAGVTSLYWVMDPVNTPIRRLADPLGGRFVLDHDTLEGTTSLPSGNCLDDARVARVARSARRRATQRSAA